MRRVVTGTNAAGRSCVLIDEELTTDGSTEYNTWTIWVNDPADLTEQVARIDPASVLPAEPKPGGSSWRRTHLPPWEEYLKLRAARPVHNIDENGFHITRTVDYMYILAGEVSLLLEEGSAELRAGDFVVQRATKHAWRSERGVEMLAVMTDALPGYEPGAAS
jgi:mannose-6-phosphate isomerase-like protein (cupin superfamily)